MIGAIFYQSCDPLLQLCHAERRILKMRGRLQNYPHPLARIQNVRDTRPSSVAIRNYLSYVVVNEFTYTGLSNVFNRFRKEVLGLAPIRYGNSGATLLDAHDVSQALTTNNTATFPSNR